MLGSELNFINYFPPTNFQSKIDLLKQDESKKRNSWNIIFEIEVPIFCSDDVTNNQDGGKWILFSILFYPFFAVINANTSPVFFVSLSRLMLFLVETTKSKLLR